MVVPMLFGGAALLLVGWIAVMLVMPSSVEAEVERELTRIRREIYRGWSDERIAARHRNFCVCEIHHLRVCTSDPRSRGATSVR